MVLALVLLGAGALLATRGSVWVPGRGTAEAPPGATSGDEPHYLLLVQSLLLDGDLDLASDYAAVAAGASRAGRRFAGVPLDHHTWVLDRQTGDRALWSALYDWRRPRPCDTPGCSPYRKLDDRLPELSPGRLERPAHPPAWPALLAGVLAPVRGDADAVERGATWVSTALILATLAATVALAAAVGLGPVGQGGAGLLVLLSPLTAYGHGLFSEPIAALLLTLGATAWLVRRPATAGLLLGLAAVVKPPWALFGLAMLALGWRSERPATRRFGVVFATIGALLLGLNVALVGGPIISGQLGWQTTTLPAGLLRTWLDGRHGLLPFLPWVVLAIPALTQRPLVVLTPALLGLGLLLSAFGSLGETCFGPRLWLPVVPLLAVAAVAAEGFVGPKLRPLWRRWLPLCAAWAAVAALPGLVAWPAAWDQPAYAMLRLLLRG